MQRLIVNEKYPGLIPVKGSKKVIKLVMSTDATCKYLSRIIRPYVLVYVHLLFRFVLVCCFVAPC